MLHSHRRANVALLIGCSLALLLAAAATADSLQPLDVGTITVGNGIVTAAAGSDNNSTARASVTINGQPATIDANGNITANVDLTGQSTLTLSVTNPTTGQTTSTTIPVSLLGPGGVIPASALDMLKQAGVNVDVPSGGYTSLAGHPVQVQGSVADKSTLASLTVNGVDALSLLGSDQTFTVPVPGTDKTVVVSATDKQGVTESSSYQITPLTRESSQSSTSSSVVTAAAASGVSIASVRYTTKGVKTRKRISVMVTVTDKRGLLIRGAKVRIRPASFQHSFVLGTQMAKTTSASGRATFTLRLRVAKFNQRRRLFTIATALTPSAQTTRTTSVRLPRLTAPHKR